MGVYDCWPRFQSRIDYGCSSSARQYHLHNYTSLVDPEAVQRVIERSSEKMLQAGESADRVNLYVRFMEQLAPPHIAIAATLITVALFGGIAALILGRC